MRSSQRRASSIARFSAARQDGAPISPRNVRPEAQHQRIVLRDHQIFQRGHAGKQPDVLKGARDLGLFGDPEIVQPLELDGAASSCVSRIVPPVGL